MSENIDIINDSSSNDEGSIPKNNSASNDEGFIPKNNEDYDGLEPVNTNDASLWKNVLKWKHVNHEWIV